MLGMESIPSGLRNDSFYHLATLFILILICRSEMASQGTAGRTVAPQTRMCQFKLVLLGESAVGKSSLVLRFVKGQFHEYQESTIGGRTLLVFCCLGCLVR